MKVRCDIAIGGRLHAADVVRGRLAHAHHFVKLPFLLIAKRVRCLGMYVGNLERIGDQLHFSRLVLGRERDAQLLHVQWKILKLDSKNYDYRIFQQQ